MAGSGERGVAARIVGGVLPPLLFGVVFLVGWELAVNVFDWKPYFLPKPSRIWDEFTDNFAQIRKAAAVSGTNALIGLIAGTVLGVAVSFVLMRFRLLNDMITPLAVWPGTVTSTSRRGWIGR